MSFFTKNDIVELAVKMELNGYTFYHSALSRNDLDNDAVKLLTKLRDDEKAHEQIFLGLRNAIDTLDMKESSNWEEAEEYMQSIVRTHVFDSPERAINLAQNAENVAEILKHALQFEKDTLIFFYTMSKYVKGKKAQQALDSIINEEMKHVKQLLSITA